LGKKRVCYWIERKGGATIVFRGYCCGKEVPHRVGSVDIPGGYDGCIKK
jgi:hypothetical protein